MMRGDAYMVVDGNVYAVSAKDIALLIYKKGLPTLVSLSKEVIMGESVERGLLPFDVMMARGNVCFDAEAHMRRFYKSLAYCGIKTDLNQKKLQGCVRKALEKSGLEKSIVRIDAVLKGEEEKRPLAFLIKIRPMPEPSTLSLKTLAHVRIRPNIKIAGDYVHAQIEMRKFLWADDILYTHPLKNIFTEVSRANIFFVRKDGNEIFLYGAEESNDILSGLTRQKILKLLMDKKYQLGENKIFFADALPVSELARIDEVFVTSSGKGIVPVKRINEYFFHTGTDEEGGPITHEIIKMFNGHIEDYYRTLSRA